MVHLWRPGNKQKQKEDKNDIGSFLQANSALLGIAISTGTLLSRGAALEASIDTRLGQVEKQVIQSETRLTRRLERLEDKF